MAQYSAHHFSMRKGYLRMVRQQNLHHHFKTHNQRLGATSSLWDMFLGQCRVRVDLVIRFFNECRAVIVFLRIF
jgi:hemerythrin